MRRRVGLQIIILAVLAATSMLALSGCSNRATVAGPEPVEEGLWILDSSQTLDEFPFGTAACAEVFPAGSSSSDTLPLGFAAAVRIVSTACYQVRVDVVDSADDTIRTFKSRFGIFNRTDDEKNRGVTGFVVWDGKDGQDREAARGRYMWRMEFDFGAGRVRKFRADIILP